MKIPMTKKRLKVISIALSVLIIVVIASTINVSQTCDINGCHNEKADGLNFCQSHVFESAYWECDNIPDFGLLFSKEENDKKAKELESSLDVTDIWAHVYDIDASEIYMIDDYIDIAEYLDFYEIDRKELSDGTIILSFTDGNEVFVLTHDVSKNIVAVIDVY